VHNGGPEQITFEKFAGGAVETVADDGTKTTIAVPINAMQAVSVVVPPYSILPGSDRVPLPSNIPLPALGAISAQWKIRRLAEEHISKMTSLPFTWYAPGASRFFRQVYP
jgi:hypothetical protein